MTDLLCMAAKPVPRYTSYPTANHFHGGIGPADAISWMQSLAAGSSLSVYLHVPYCQSLCAYCGCHTFATRKLEPVMAYVDHLVVEIGLSARHLKDVHVKHLHWGGGTPSLVGAVGFLKIFEALQHHYDLSSLAEHAIELDPRSIPDDLLATFASAGINRVSLGVQDLDARVQKVIGRVQPVHVIDDAVQRLRKHGFCDINMDLIYGLPEQTLESFRQTLDHVLLWKPQRLAVFGYAHVPWFKSRQKLIHEPDLPDTELRLRMADLADQLLLSAGYVRVGFDHYALPDDALALAVRNGTLKRNFQGYTSDPCDALLGLGASSISSWPTGYSQNAADLGRYREALAHGELPVVRGFALSEADRERAAVIQSLLCQFSFTAQSPTQKFLLQNAFLRLRPFLEAGLVSVSEQGLVMLEAARPYARLIAACFDSYLEDTHTARHAKAV